jgi:hypothetical protein
MRELSIWLNAHCPRGDRGVFRSAAELHDASTTDIVHSVEDGDDLLEVLKDQTDTFDHVVIAGHGGTTWLLDDEYGVTTGDPIRGGQIGVHELAKALTRVTQDGVLISLAACLCSRSPRWFLLHRFGRSIGSDWGPRAYLPGGQASFSARLRDYMRWYGVAARVRGHRAAGHATALSLLAEHSGIPGSLCETLFQRALLGVEPTILVRRKWVKSVTGDLAQRWLMGDDSVEEEIRNRW